MKKQKKVLSALTIRRLRRVALAILAEPKLYDQGSVFHLDRDCGTRACLLGWATALFAPRKTVNLTTFDEGAVALGLKPEYFTDGDIELGFSPARRLYSRWPQKFRKAHDAAKTPRGKAAVAARRIEHFIATDGAE